MTSHTTVEPKLADVPMSLKEVKNFAPIWHRESGYWNDFVAFTSEGHVASAGEGVFELLSKDDGKVLKSFRYCMNGVPVGLIDDKTWLVACSDTLTKYATETGAVITRKQLDDLITLAILGKNFAVVVLASEHIQAFRTIDFSHVADETFFSPLRALALEKNKITLYMLIDYPEDDPGIGIWDIERDIAYATMIPARGHGDFLAVSASGSLLAVETDGFEVTLYKTQNGAPLKKIKSGSWTSDAVFLNEDVLVLAGSKGLTLYDLKEGTETVLLTEGAQENVAISPDGMRIVAGDRQGIITSFLFGASGTLSTGAPEKSQNEKEHLNEFKSYFDDDKPAGIEGTIIKKKDAALVFKMSSDSGLPAVKFSCDVSVYFENTAGGLAISGWMISVKVEILAISGAEIKARITEKISDGTINGEATDFLNIGDRIRLICQEKK